MILGVLYSMKLTKNTKLCWAKSDGFILLKDVWLTEREQILKNQDNIEPDKAFEYVMENHYDEVREAVFEQEADNRRE